MGEIEILVFKVLAVLAVGALLVKRAVRGPQIQFARLACLAILAGIVALMSASRQGDFASWVGAVLLTSGMLVAIVMVVADMAWTVRSGLAAWNRKQ